MPWYRYGYSEGGWGNGPSRNYGIRPEGAVSKTVEIEQSHGWRCPAVTIKVFWSPVELKDRWLEEYSPEELKKKELKV